jgi:hypothetical protein
MLLTALVTAEINYRARQIFTPIDNIRFESSWLMQNNFVH